MLRRRARTRPQARALLLVALALPIPLGLLPITDAASAAPAAPVERAGATRPGGPAGPELVRDTRSVTASAAEFSAVRNALAGRERVPVLVGLKALQDNRNALDRSQRDGNRGRIAGARKSLADANPWIGARSLIHYDDLGYVGLEVTATELAQLERSGAAASIGVPGQSEPQLDVTTRLVQSAPEVSHRFDGSGRSVAILDSGVDGTHPYFAGTGRIVEEACYSFGNNCPGNTGARTGPGSAPPCTFFNERRCAHGTGVAGVAAGLHSAELPDFTFDGVAPGASIMPVRIVSQNLVGSPTAWDYDVLRGLGYVYDRVVNYGSKVAAVNLSYGQGNYNATTCAQHVSYTAIRQAIINLRAIGIPTIISAGNGGQATGVSFPGCIAEAVTVGATLKGDTGMSPFSQSSTRVDLLAPGGDNTGTENDILAPYSPHPVGYDMVRWSGTSFAAPHVAGAWAIYKEAYEGANDVEATLARFRATGNPITDPRNGLTIPRLDIAAATAGWAFLFADNPTTTSLYTPSLPLQASSTGLNSTIQRNNTGVYTVNIPKLGKGDQGSGVFAGGNVQVSAYGYSTHRCKSNGTYRANGFDLQVLVLCFNLAGTPADGTFTLVYHSNESVRLNQAAYVTSTVASPPAEYEPNLIQQASSRPGINRVSKTATGVYTVTFPDFTFSAQGDVQVTAVGPNSDYCNVRDWGMSTATVGCYTTTGTAVDSPFSLAYTADAAINTIQSGRPGLTHPGAYVRADQPTNASWYTPTAAYNWKSGGGTLSARRTNPGAYEVRIPNQTSTNKTNVLVTAFGTTSATCRPTGWTLSGTDAIATIWCLTATGASADVPFTFLYTGV
jgi:subtilisin